MNQYEEGIVRIPPYVAIPDGIRALSQVSDWGHTVLKPEVFWKKGNKGQKAIIFILDTAGDFDHPDLAERNIKELNFNLTGDPDKDLNGHGTHCAGIAAASNNAFGVVGLAPEAYLVAGKILGDNGSGSTNKIAEAIRYVADLELPSQYKECTKIISMSFGSSLKSKLMENAITYAIQKGVRCVAAAGNYGQDRDGYMQYPGSYDNVITVAAIDKNKKAAYFTGKTEFVDLAAPGVGVYSTHIDYGYAYLSGTSMACPYISGLVALIETEYGHERYSHSALEAYLEEYTEDLGEAGKDNILGAGLPLLSKYLDNKPGQGEPDPEPEPDPTLPMPTRDKRVVRIAVNEPMLWLWRRQSEKQYSILEITDYSANIESSLHFTDINDYFLSELKDFPKNRALVVPDGMDEEDAVYYFTIFLGYALNQQFKFSTTSIIARDDASRIINPTFRLRNILMPKAFMRKLAKQEFILEQLPQRIYDKAVEQAIVNPF